MLLGAMVLAATIALGGCGQSEQTITVTSEPDGALVYANGMEVGRTPVTFDYIWYGDYSFELRKEGYETLKTHRHVRARPHEWVPFDIFFAMLPMKTTDDKFFHFELKPLETVSDQTLIDRGNQMRDRTLHSDQ